MVVVFSKKNKPEQSPKGKPLCFLKTLNIHLKGVSLGLLGMSTAV